MVHNNLRRAHLVRRTGAVTAAMSVAVLAFAAPAGAHVRADDDPLPQGGYGIVRLIVPGESEGVSTVGLSVTVPEGVDLTSARTQPIAGWTATVEREPSGSAERVSKIVWTANDPSQGFSSAEYREFTFSAGPWPEDTESVALPSDQQYSDGSVVAWDEVAVDDASEPEHPAPEVTLAAASDAHSHGDGHGADTASSGHSEATADGSGGSNAVWQTISVVSLVLALGASVGLAVVLRRGSAPRS